MGMGTGTGRDGMGMGMGMGMVTPFPHRSGAPPTPGVGAESGRSVLGEKTAGMGNGVGTEGTSGTRRVEGATARSGPAP